MSACKILVLQTSFNRQENLRHIWVFSHGSYFLNSLLVVIISEIKPELGEKEKITFAVSMLRLLSLHVEKKNASLGVLASQIISKVNTLQSFRNSRTPGPVVSYLLVTPLASWEELTRTHGISLVHLRTKDKMNE